MSMNPTYQSGFASPQRGRLKYPGLWRSCVGAWAPCLGPSGVVLRDHSGLGNHGTLTNLTPGTCWNTEDGVHGIRFVGGSSPSSHIAVGNSPLDISNYTQPFTVQAWIKVRVWRGVIGNETFNIMNIGTADYDSMNVMIWKRRITFVADIDRVVGWQMGDTVTVGDTNLEISKRYHVAVTRNGAGVYTAWLNGKQDGNENTPTNLTVNNQTMRIGAHYGLNTTYDTDGWIYNVQFSSREFSASEIALAASRPGIAYELAPRRRSSIIVPPSFKAAWLTSRQSQIIGGGMR